VVSQPVETKGADHHPQPLPQEGRLGEEDLLQGGIYIAGHKEILVTVGIGVEEDRSGRPALDTRALRHGSKSPVSLIAIENVRAKAGHKQIGQPVAIQITGGDTGTPLIVTHSRSLGDVQKGAVALVAVEQVAAALRDLGSVEPPAVDQEKVQIPVPVVVEERQTGAS
jgi:hypothetical protein